MTFRVWDVSHNTPDITPCRTSPPQAVRPQDDRAQGLLLAVPTLRHVVRALLTNGGFSKERVQQFVFVPCATAKRWILF